MEQDTQAGSSKTPNQEKAKRDRKKHFTQASIIKKQKPQARRNKTKQHTLGITATTRKKQEEAKHTSNTKQAMTDHITKKTQYTQATRTKTKQEEASSTSKKKHDFTSTSKTKQDKATHARTNRHNQEKPPPSNIHKK